MTITIIDDKFSVSGSLNDEDMITLKKRGVTTLICTRYNYEEADQPTWRQMAKLAETYKLNHFHVPVKSDHYNYNRQDIIRFWQAFCTAQGKVHGYCHTGKRASHLWALGLVIQGKKMNNLLKLLTDKGFDMDKLSPPL